MLWKITDPNGICTSYREDADVAEYYMDKGYKVECYTKTNGDYRETKSPIFNVTLTEENCGKVIADMLMECAERLGNFPKAQIDARAWSHLLVYAPKYICIARAAGWTFDPSKLDY